MARRNSRSENAGWVGFSTWLQEQTVAMAKRMCFVVHPNYTIKQWEDMIVRPEDAALLKKAASICSQFYKSSTQTIFMTHEGEKCTLELSVHYQAERQFLWPNKGQNVPPPAVLAGLVDLRSRAEDAAIVKLAVEHVFKVNSSMAQVAKWWPELFRIHEPNMTGKQREVAAQALASASNARVPEPSAELRKVLSFCNFKLAQNSMAPAVHTFEPGVVKCKFMYRDSSDMPELTLEPNVVKTVKAEYPW